MRNKFRTIRKRVLSDVSGKSRVQQAFKDECDINRIVKKANQNGFLPPAQKQPQYLDAPMDVSSYHEALNLVIDAQDRFDSLPSHLRKRFMNDPAEFIAFAQDPKNSAELVQMGLATKRDNSNDVIPTPEPKQSEAKNKNLAPKGDETPDHKPTK